MSSFYNYWAKKDAIEKLKQKGYIEEEARKLVDEWDREAMQKFENNLKKLKEKIKGDEIYEKQRE